MIKQMEHATGVIVRSPSRLTEHRDGDSTGMARPHRIYTANADSNWNSGWYAYDGAGDITKIGPNWYLYDGLGRLKQGTAQLDGGSVSARSYAYDGFGNLTRLDGRTIGVNHATNRLTGASYDTAGNELSWGTGGLTYSYTYYPQNQIRSITGGSPSVDRIYGYTADGERIGAFANSGPDAGVTYTIRDLEGHVLRQLLEKDNGNSWTWKEDYVWGPTGLLATVSSTEGTKHYVNDHLGSPRLVRNRCAHTLAQHNYYPYGEEATYAYQDRERIKFTGHERDLGLDGQTTDDLDYMHARHFNLHLGRFLSTDPIGGSIGSSQSWSRYSYVLGHPINATDPTGTLPLQPPGPEDRPRNVELAGTTVTVEGAVWTSVTWPEDPDVHIPSRTSAFSAELDRAIAQTLALSLSGISVGDTPVHEVLLDALGSALQDGTGAWEGHESARDAVETLGIRRFFLATLDHVRSSAVAIQEQLAIQAHIAELGGVAEEVATGVMESGLSGGPGGILIVGTAWGSWGLGGVIRRHLIPDSWNRAIGDAELGGINFLLQPARIVPPSWTVVGRP